jgi:hypothetical protein
MRMFENRVHRKVLRPKRNEVTSALRRICNKEPYDLSSSPNIIWMIKSKRIGGGGMQHVWGTGGVHTGLWWGKLMERDHLEDLGVDERLILKWNWIFKKWDGGHGLDGSDSG